MGDNPKQSRVRRRRVQHHPSIKISHLKEMGLLKPSERTRYDFPGAVRSAFTCDLREKAYDHGGYIFVIEYDTVMQFLSLVARKAGRGLRYYFRDENDVVCEHLYPWHGHYVSRKTAGLAYLSQIQSPLERKIAKAKRISWDVLGKPGRGPARGRSREKKLAKLEMVRAELDDLSKLIMRERRKPRRPRKEEVLRALALTEAAKKRSELD
jgi:hypothetical protein